MFISRGDNSGTYVKELSIWDKTALNPKGKSWYKECGYGIDQDLVMVSELRRYTLSDAGTYLQFKKEGRLPNLNVIYGNPTDLDFIKYIAYTLSKAVAGSRGAMQRTSQNSSMRTSRS